MLNRTNKTLQLKPKLKITNKVKDYGNDPYFIKKAKESKKFLEENGFPKEILNKKMA